MKMQGLGNDFVFLKGTKEPKAELIQKLCDRHFGIGADGLIVVTKLGPSKIEMKYWNADGTPAEMCGNGLRCTVRFAVENGLVKPGDITVKTGAGLRKAVWDGEHDNIEVQVAKVKASTKPLKLDGHEYFSADAGNPHAVRFVDDTESFPVTETGQRVETNKAFPNKTNVEFVQIMAPGCIRLRVWERGVGETLACGTGMAASSTVAANVKGVKFPVIVDVTGGSATLWQDDEGFIRMKAPAETVFEGDISI